MPTPLTDPQLSAAAREIAVGMIGGLAPGMTGLNLAAEVAEKVTAPYAAEVARLRTELEQARAAALREAADLLADRGYHLPADLVLRLPALPPAPACTCRAEAVHQAGCDTSQHA